MKHQNFDKNHARNTFMRTNMRMALVKRPPEEFDIGLRRIKVKITVGVQSFSPFTTIQTVRSYIYTLVRARNLILSM